MLAWHVSFPRSCSAPRSVAVANVHRSSHARRCQLLLLPQHVCSNDMSSRTILEQHDAACHASWLSFVCLVPYWCETLTVQLQQPASTQICQADLLDIQAREYKSTPIVQTLFYVCSCTHLRPALLGHICIWKLLAADSSCCNAQPHPGNTAAVPASCGGVSQAQPSSFATLGPPCMQTSVCFCLCSGRNRQRCMPWKTGGRSPRELATHTVSKSLGRAGWATC